MSDDIADDPEFIAFAEEAIGTLLPMMQDSAMVVSLVPRGPVDVKYAIELGFALMLDKPIIAVVRPGTPVPKKLMLVADHIVEGDLGDEEGRTSLMRRLEEISKQYPNPGEEA